MISYAQNFEDVRLARAFDGVDDGFYIDVGAAHPTDHSVTRLLYDRGWSGVDVEPHAPFARLLREQRPRDVTLEIAVSSGSGETVLFVGHDGEGSATLEADVAERLEREGAPIRRRSVPSTTLAAICAKHAAARTVDVLKVDVEGHEAAVLSGADWRRWRPTVVVVEATRPHTTEPSHEEWEPVLFEADYEFAVFDGINRFYAVHERPELLEPLARPVSALDGCVRHLESRQAAEIERLAREVESLRSALRQARVELGDRDLQLEAAMTALRSLALEQAEPVPPVTRPVTLVRRVIAALAASH